MFINHFCHFGLFLWHCLLGIDEWGFIFLKKKLSVPLVQIPRYVPSPTLAPSRSIQKHFRHKTVQTTIFGREKKDIGLIYVYSPGGVKIDFPVLFNLPLLSNTHFNTLDVRGLTFYRTFCKHFSAQAHSFEVHLCSNRHTKNVCARCGLQFP